jgi:hypothetical protein
MFACSVSFQLACLFLRMLHLRTVHCLNTRKICLSLELTCACFLVELEICMRRTDRVVIDLGASARRCYFQRYR